jgi:hypothetical protein
MGWRAGATGYRTAIAGRAPSAGGGQFWLVLAGDAAVDGGDRLPANSCIFVGPEDPAFAGAAGPVGGRIAVPAIPPPRAGLNPARYGRICTVGSGVISRANSSMDVREIPRFIPHRLDYDRSDWLRCPLTPV